MGDQLHTVSIVRLYFLYAVALPRHPVPSTVFFCCCMSHSQQVGYIEGAKGCFFSAGDTLELIPLRWFVMVRNFGQGHVSKQSP